MITIFENCGFVYKIEARNDGIRLFVAANHDKSPIELLRIGIISLIEWQLLYKA